MNSDFTILLIDDIEENIYSLQLLIENNFTDIKIISALNAKEAIFMLMKNDVDLILSDIQMPEINGFELVEYLGEVEQTRDIPVVLITGIHNSNEYIKRGFQSGAIDYITKPIDDEILCSKLNIYIDIFDERRFDKDRRRTFYKQEKINNMICALDYFPDQIKQQFDLNDYKEVLRGDRNNYMYAQESLGGEKGEQ